MKGDEEVPARERKSGRLVGCEETVVSWKARGKLSQEKGEMNGVKSC